MLKTAKHFSLALIIALGCSATTPVYAAKSSSAVRMAATAVKGAAVVYFTGSAGYDSYHLVKDAMNGVYTKENILKFFQELGYIVGNSALAIALVDSLMQQKTPEVDDEI